MVGRVVSALILSLVLVGLVGAVSFAGQPGSSAGAGNGCQGITNAYAHAADAALPALTAVADKLGCDLSGVQRVAKPAQANKPDKPEAADNDADENADEKSEPDEDTDKNDAEVTDAEAAGPDVDAKCAKIAEKLTAAQARPHGKSADAFARQAEHWGCDSN